MMLIAAKVVLSDKTQAQADSLDSAIDQALDRARHFELWRSPNKIPDPESIGHYADKAVRMARIALTLIEKHDYLINPTQSDYTSLNESRCNKAQAIITRNAGAIRIH